MFRRWIHTDHIRFFLLPIEIEYRVFAIKSVQIPRTTNAGKKKPEGDRLYDRNRKFYIARIIHVRLFSAHIPSSNKKDRTNKI